MLTHKALPFCLGRNSCCYLVLLKLGLPDVLFCRLNRLCSAPTRGSRLAVLVPASCCLGLCGVLITLSERSGPGSITERPEQGCSVRTVTFVRRAMGLWCQLAI